MKFRETGLRRDPKEAPPPSPVRLTQLKKKTCCRVPPCHFSSRAAAMCSPARLFLLQLLLLLVAVCSANLATGRASLRPSAGKRSSGGAVFVARTPAHYYHLAAAQRFDDEVSCDLSTMAVLTSRYERVRDELDELAELLDTCQTLRAAI